MVVNTNRRTYSIKLVSREKDWMPAVNFDYPEVVQSEWDAYYAAQQQEKAQKTLGDGLNIDNLDFAYRIEGKADFKPVRVYNNGIKTFIELPRSVSSGELPTVLVVNSGSGEKEIVNYGFKDNKFIVDQLARQLILVQGVGSNQESVLISRER
jgi:P-type conjugative transfer protein TrbG